MTRGIHHFLGNVTSHVIHAKPVFDELGGTFVALSEQAGKEIESYGVPVIVLDDEPDEFVRLSRRVSATFDYLNQHADVVVFYDIFRLPWGYRRLKPPTVFLGHGVIGLKDFLGMSGMRRRAVKSYDYIAASGPYARRRFVEKDGIDAGKLVDLGVARTDRTVLHRGQVFISEATSTETGLTTERPTVAYMPTYWGRSSVDELGLQIVENISDDYMLVVRPHPQTPTEILSKYEALCAGMSNVLMAPHGRFDHLGVVELFDASSVIIGDVSSVIQEAILLDKPLIFARDVDDRDRDDLTAISSLVEFSERVDTSNVERLSEIVERSIDRGIDPAVWEETKSAMFYHYDGTSARSIAEFVRSIG